ncbi:1,4-dihydroxy-2-naphthoate polyprenyltransferase [Candidatus Marinamargulisbacteria bacterium SCGC AG-343-D04]|nr:1,4-dihydroxy-2-naphthoate polyprenyltransferase [Candidatus Marinamargulisbacteria bacterium SCGC AG-343-D04]
MIKYWIFATRPKTLSASIGPVFIGVAMASQTNLFSWDLAIITGLCAVLLQIGTNLANDYLDFLKGADKTSRKGPPRMVQQGFISVNAMKRATFLSFFIAFLIGLYLVYRSDLWILFVGILSILGGYFYTAGKRPLAYLGLGDIMAFLFFGPVAVGGSYYIQTLSLSADVLVLGAGMGCLSTALLAVNNLRDYQEDKKANKRTLIVLLGTTFGRLEYSICLLTSWGILFWLCWGMLWCNIGIIALFFWMLVLVRGVYAGKNWQWQLEKTASLLFFFPAILFLFLFL